jgi:hypothetical protein
MNMKSFTACTVLALILPAGFIFAHPTVSSEDAMTQNYCLKVVVFEVENAKRVSEIREAHVTKENEVIAQLQSIWKKQDEDIVAHKRKIEALYDEHIARLSDKTAQDKVKEIQTEYIKAFDSAIEDYRAAIKEAINARKATYVAAEVKFVNRVNDILAKTKRDCDAKAEVKGIFAYLTTELKSAHNALIASINGLSGSAIPVFDRQKIAAAREKFDNDIAALLQLYK